MVTKPKSFQLVNLHLNMNIFGFSDSNLPYDTMSIWVTTFWINPPNPYPKNPRSNEAPSVNYNVWYVCEKSSGWMESSPKQLHWTQRNHPGKQPIKGRGWKQGHPTPQITIRDYPTEPRKKPYYFPLYWVDLGWFIGTLIMVYHKSLYNWVGFHPPYNPTNQVFFHCSTTLKKQIWHLETYIFAASGKALESFIHYHHARCFLNVWSMKPKIS